MYAKATAAPYARERPRVQLAPPDAALFAIAAALVGAGLVMVFSASSAMAYSAFHDTTYFLKRQAVYALLGTLVAYAAYRVDYPKLRRIAPGVFIATFVALVLTLVPHVGQLAGGARRWLGAGPLAFQPSEVAKLALVLFLAAKLSTLGDGVRSITRGVVPALLFAIALALPIFAEPDMGTASLVFFIAFGMLFCAGARIEHLVLTVLAVLPPVAILVNASPYKRARVLAFLDPWKDAQNTGFHIVQSLLALGSGGLFGLGLGASRQKFFYLPEAYTDFIFAVTGEELGLLGTLTIVALFAAFAVRAFMLARRVDDRFGFLLVVGCTLLIVIQAFINIGVVTSSWPVTGVPLPFISYGGTSLIVNLAAVGLMLNVTRRRAR